MISEQRPLSQSNGANPRPGEIEITRILFILWQHRKFVAIVTTIFTLLGLILGLIGKPSYYSEATFTVKGTNKESGVASIFSQFGTLGSQLGAASGTTSITKIEVILKGHELSEAVVENNHLMPKLFPKQWDSVNGRWKEIKDPKMRPTLRRAGDNLKSSLKIDIDDKKGLVHLGTMQSTPEFAKEIVEYYISGLNDIMRQKVVADAELNRKFLEDQASHVTDPILLDQLNALIALEVQKVMLASSNSLDVLESPQLPLMRSAPKRKQLLIISFIGGLFISSFGVFAWLGFKKLRSAMTTMQTESATTRSS